MNEETFLAKFKRQFVKNYENAIPEFIAEKIMANVAPGYYQRAIFVLENGQEISGFLLYSEEPFWVIVDEKRAYVTTLVKSSTQSEEYVYLE